MEDTTLIPKCRPRTHEVSVTDSQFQPALVDAVVGDVVRWRIVGQLEHVITVHHGGESTAESAVLCKGDVFQHAVDTTGLFSYAFGLYPRIKGTVRVTPAPSPLSELRQESKPGGRLHASAAQEKRRARSPPSAATGAGDPSAPPQVVEVWGERSASATASSASSGSGDSSISPTEASATVAAKTQELRAKMLEAERDERRRSAALRAELIELDNDGLDQVAHT